jgi:hypothetical protein
MGGELDPHTGIARRAELPFLCPAAVLGEGGRERRE